MNSLACKRLATVYRGKSPIGLHSMSLRQQSLTRARCLFYRPQLGTYRETMMGVCGGTLAKRTFFRSAKARSDATAQLSLASSSLNASAFDFPVTTIAGNASFMFALFAYSNKDMLTLRLSALGATISSLLFQYCRPVPIWFSIKRSMVIFTINAAMAIALIHERNQAESMPREFQQIYEQAQFRHRGFSKVEFRRLFSMGEKKTLPRGYILARDNTENNKLYLVLNGKISIEKDNRQIATVDDYHFINEMSFLLYRYAKDEGDNDQARDETVPQKFVATADACVNTEKGVTCWVWDFHELKSRLEHDRQVSNAFSSYLNHDLRDKLINASTSSSSSSSSPAANPTSSKVHTSPSSSDRERKQ